MKFSFRLVVFLLLVTICSSCVGGSRGTGIRTLEPRPHNDEQLPFGWGDEREEECDGRIPCRD